MGEMTRGPEFAQFRDILRTKVESGKSPIDDQTVAKPTFWIEVTSGMSGYFAVMLWDGCGFPEPWETGDGRYGEPEPAEAEARRWAADENVEFRP